MKNNEIIFFALQKKNRTNEEKFQRNQIFDSFLSIFFLLLRRSSTQKTEE